MDLTKAKIWFVTLSTVIFVLFAISAMQEQNREWKKYQEEYYAMEKDRGIDRDYSVTVNLVIYQWTLNFHPYAKNNPLL